jgi:hypothetical protein
MYARLLFVVVGIFGPVSAQFHRPIWPHRHDQARVVSCANTLNHDPIESDYDLISFLCLSMIRANAFSRLLAKGKPVPTPLSKSGGRLFFRIML